MGPTLQGIWGRPIELEDGSTVVADEAYLRTSIMEPRAQIVKGYRLPMPTNNLDDAEIDRVLDFIEAIGPEAGADG